MTRNIFIPLAIAAAAVAVACGNGGHDDSDTSMDSAEDTAQEGDGEDTAGEPDADPDADADAVDGPEGVLACELPPRTFWTWDLTDMPPSDVQVDATCRGWGPHVAVYVVNDIWGTSMAEADVESVVSAFEDATPADATRGIYDVVTGTFGDPPDIDGDPRVVLLYDSLGSFMGSSFDGFFRADDETTCTTCNATEMLFLDGVRNPAGSEYMLSIIAHEFQHLVHYRWDANEDAWVGEAMSEASMALCGYFTDTELVRQFAFAPDTALVTTSFPDYGAEFLYGLYLTEQLGPDFLFALVHEPGNGVAGFDTAASPYGTDMATVFSDWVIANYLDDPALADGAWGYETYDFPNMAVDASAADGTLESKTVSGWAADYLLYTLAPGGGDLAVRLDSTSWTTMGATVVSFDSADAGSAPVVTPVSLTSASTETSVTIPALHDRATIVVFALAEGSYSYQHAALW